MDINRKISSESKIDQVNKNDGLPLEKPGKWEYVRMIILIFLILFAIGFIIWTYVGYQTNFVEIFQK